MASVHVNVRLRPIKLAFLVDPSDTDSLLRAIEINTCLWGGTFNPLIPTYRRLPKRFKEFGRLNGKSLVEGYLNAFDPDYLVRLGKTADYDLVFRDVKSISSDEILRTLDHDGTPAYGIGLFEILNELIESEFKYLRREPANIVLSNLSSQYRPLLASVFGLLPDTVRTIYQTDFQDIIGSHEQTYSITNYLEGLFSQQSYLRQITATFHLDIRRKSVWPKDACLFFLDASKTIDVIDYWNLRAVGWRVVPIAKQAFLDESSHRFIVQFVKDHHGLMQREPPVFHTTTLLKSRSVEKQDFERFATEVNRLTFEQGGESKVSTQTWYPRMWEDWGSKRDFVEVCELDAGTESHLLNDLDERISFKPLSPQFVTEFGGRGQPRYVNEVNLRVASGDKLYAEVVPEGTREVRRAFGYFGELEGVRLSRRGIVKLLRHPVSHQRLLLPKSEIVFEAWLESLGWKANLSAPGLIARQMFKQIGGIWGIPILARGSLIKLLQQMNEREDKTQDQGKPTKQNTLLRELSGIAKLEGHSNSKYILQQLTDSGILRVGLEIQCSTCTRRSWYSLKEIDYSNTCVNCGEVIDIPAHAPERMRWSYRTAGPFRSSNQSDGAYAVLLTLRFFSMLYDGATTALFSFNATKNQTSIEADLGLLFQKTLSYWANTRIKTIFAECKTFNHFKPQDIRRMQIIGEHFPDAFIVFATLRNTLEEKEKQLLRPFVERNRKRAEKGKLSNSILVLTGIELLSPTQMSPPFCWEDIGGKHATFEKRTSVGRHFIHLADATQQLYLDMEGYRYLPIDDD